MQVSISQILKTKKDILKTMVLIFIRWQLASSLFIKRQSKLIQNCFTAFSVACL